MTWGELQKQDRADLGAIFSTREGARFFSALLDLCGVFRLSYQGEETPAAAFHSRRARATWACRS